MTDSGRGDPVARTNPEAGSGGGPLSVPPTRGRVVRPARRLVTDLVVVVGGLAAVATVRVLLDAAVPAADVVWLMALLAAAIGSAAALLGVLLAWLVADQRVGWLSVALACHCLVAVPSAALGARQVLPAPVAGAAAVVAEGAVTTLLLLAVTVPRSLYRWRARDAAFVVLGLVVAGALLAVVVPGVSAAAATPFRVAVALTWSVLALTLAVLTARRRLWDLWRVGTGFALLGAVVVARLAVPTVAADVGLTLSNLRLLGVGLVFWGVVGLAWRALTDLGSVSAAQEEELRLAEIRLARAAERDHELRNGLAGLAGVTSVLRQDRPEAAGLSRLVASELVRLDDLLDPPTLPRPAASSSYEVAPVLAGLTALRRSAGMVLHLDAPPGVRARGSSQTLAQVVTNLLGNAGRHAPGSPVWITLRREDPHVVVEVRDAGPGIPPGREEAVFGRGERDPAGGGSGLGLAVCRRMLAGQDARIAVRGTGGPGCVVVIELPAAPVPDAETAAGDVAEGVRT